MFTTNIRYIILRIVISFLINFCFVSIYAIRKADNRIALPIPQDFSQISDYYIRKGEPTKAKAAEFLLANMQYHFAYFDSSCESLLLSIDSISHLYKYPKGISHYQALYARKSITKTIIQDSSALTPLDIIENIDASFFDWKKGKWAQHLSFEQFCEFLLPYRILYEKYESWRPTLRNVFMKYAFEDSLCSDKKHSTFWAARSVCEGLKKYGFHIDDKALPKSFIQLPPKVLLNMHMGDCHSLAILTTYIMRACGIPVACDFTPQWPNKANRHSWNALLNNTGKIIPFIGSDIYPGQYDLPGRYLSKVYRYTFEYQKGSAYDLCKKYKEPLPPSLEHPFIKDVSNDYFDGIDVTINIKSMPLKRKVVFIAVFDNSTWIPVDTGIIDSLGNVSFKSLGRGIVYTPVVWTPNGSLTCGAPFLLDYNGSIKTFIPDVNRNRKVRLERKYPLFSHIYDFAKEMRGGVIEASNSRNFENAEKMGEINFIPNTWYNEIAIKDTSRNYQYWRYFAPQGSKCNIAEIEFLDNGKAISASEYICDDIKRNGSKVKLAFDNNRLTYYVSAHMRGAWVGVDMGEPKPVTSVRFLPRNDDNHIVKSHIYQLSYFNENGEQIPIETKIAENDSLSFNNVPCEALLILHDLTGGREERIFSYHDGSVNWY